jgi:hypothetical protein
MAQRFVPGTDQRTTVPWTASMVATVLAAHARSGSGWIVGQYRRRSCITGGSASCTLLAASHGRLGLSILLHQFKGLIVLLLVAATVVAFLMGESVEASAILVVILLHASIITGGARVPADRRVIASESTWPTWKRCTRSRSSAPP